MLSGLGTIHVHQVVGQPRGLLGAETCRAERFEVQLAGFALNFEDL